MMTFLRAVLNRSVVNDMTTQSLRELRIFFRSSLTPSLQIRQVASQVAHQSARVPRGEHGLRSPAEFPVRLVEAQKLPSGQRRGSRAFAPNSRKRTRREGAKIAGTQSPTTGFHGFHGFGSGFLRRSQKTRGFSQCVSAGRSRGFHDFHGFYGSRKRCGCGEERRNGGNSGNGGERELGWVAAAFGFVSGRFRRERGETEDFHGYHVFHDSERVELDGRGSDLFGRGAKLGAPRVGAIRPEIRDFRLSRKSADFASAGSARRNERNGALHR